MTVGLCALDVKPFLMYTQKHIFMLLKKKIHIYVNECKSMIDITYTRAPTIQTIITQWISINSNFKSTNKLYSAEIA